MTIGRRVRQGLKDRFVRSRSVARLTTGRMLRVLREKHGWTQRELASRCGLAQATISSLENAVLRLGVERSKALARALHVHPAALLFPDWEVEAA